MDPDYSSRYTPPKQQEVKKPTNNAEAKAKEFFSGKTQSKRQHLLSIVHYESQQLPEKTLAQYLLDASEQKLQNGLYGIEIETKLNVKNNSNPLRTQLISFAIELEDRFLSNDYIDLRSETVHYYERNGVECFALMEYENGACLKIKEPIQPYFEVATGEEFVLRRPESIVSKLSLESPQNVKSLVDTLLDVTGKSAKHIGTMSKQSAQKMIVERTTGRVYGMCLGYCTAPNREALMQLEIEYAGFIPNFQVENMGLFRAKAEIIPPEQENSIVKDLVDLSNFFASTYSMEPTTLTKFQWLNNVDLNKSPYR